MSLIISRNITIITVICTLTTSVYSDSRFNVLYKFTGGTDGEHPVAGLAIVGSTLYGSTAAVHNGDKGLGTLYSINTDGSNFQTLHTFTGSDGMNPQASLTAIGSTLYGTTAGPRSGQPDLNRGTIFSIQADGTNFQTLHTLPYHGNDGYYPSSTLTPIGSVFYGTDEGPGNTRSNAVYTFDTNNNNFNIINTFPVINRGPNYSGGVTEHGNILYGTMNSGGANDEGFVYSMNLDATNVQILHDFSGSPPSSTNQTIDGAYPETDLTIVGSRIYGTTTYGGFYFNNTPIGGTWFSMNLDGTGYQTIHQFQGQPASALIEYNSRLYGSDNGGIYSIKLDGSDFRTERSFPTSSNDGFYPAGNLLLVEDALYGVALFGGTGNNGSIYSLHVPEISPLLLISIGAVMTLLPIRFWRGSRSRRQQRIASFVQPRQCLL